MSTELTPKEKLSLIENTLEKGRSVHFIKHASWIELKPAVWKESIQKGIPIVQIRYHWILGHPCLTLMRKNFLQYLDEHTIITNGNVRGEYEGEKLPSFHEIVSFGS